MKRIKSWLVIIVIAVLVCAAFAFLVIGAWWNYWAIVCIAVLIYVAIREW